MFPFKKILFPVDYSTYCDAVAPYVREMAQRYSARLALVHAYAGEAFLYGEMPAGYGVMLERARDYEQGRLREYAAQKFPDQRAETYVEFHEPGTAILKAVEHESTDLVMMATHGRGPVRRLLMGSVTAKTLHDVSAAVWTGAGRVLIDHEPRIPYQSILCALDESDEAEPVLQLAASMACAYGANLWIVRVLEIPMASAEVDMAPYIRDSRDAVEFGLRELKGKLKIEAPSAVIEGTVAEGVRDEAVRRHADLIVTGRGHARNRLGRMWSSLYPIIRESPCPVLSV